MEEIMLYSNPFARASDGGGPLLCYRADADHWRIVWPCTRCGGVELPLLARLDEPAPASLACPGCHAHDKRRAASRGPELWWDPQVSGWVVRIPCGSHASAILPLGIPWYDAPPALIHTAAADLVYLGELDDVSSRD
jgi:hypothetical protein